MNKFFFIIIVYASCSNSVTIDRGNGKSITNLLFDSVVYVGKDYKISIFIEDNVINGFKISNIKNGYELSGKPELITIDGEIPEGTNRIDYNDPNNIEGFSCDSAYQFLTKEINIAFALENITRQRLDLSIYNSSNVNFTNGDYTLNKKK